MNDEIKLKLQKIASALLGVLMSRKFWVLFVSLTVAHFGLELSDEMTAMLLFLSAAIWSGATAYEDAAEKRGQRE